MVATSKASRAKPAKIVKRGTETTNSHRFEPFSQRIAKLKVDPIHRVRRRSFGEEDGDETFSYFRSSLDHWVVMNLSENFTNFSRRVSPLCESLAQILHHEDRIMASLVEYIEKKDQLSMEPLLSLLAQFAHDLGTRFEKHFEAAITLVVSVAAHHPDVEVVEWCFTCLAWMYKFLSRLLVPDLRQLLRIMSPYLGKERQKPFVARFTAESMSFLIRKAGLQYFKDTTPLGYAVSFLFRDIRDVADTQDVESYKEGLMAMFSDAVKGVNGGVNSNGPDILRCIIDNVLVGDEIQGDLAEQILTGLLINIIHNTNADTFECLFNVIYAYLETATENSTSRHAKLMTRLAFLSVVTRKGSRVKDWKRVNQSLVALLQRASSAIETYQQSVTQLLATVAFALQFSPMDEILPFMRPLMEAVTSHRFSSYFLFFCATFADFGSDRFHTVVLPYFERFIRSSWKNVESELCLTLVQLGQAGCITSQASKPGHITFPDSWTTHITTKLNGSVPDCDEVALFNAYCRLFSLVSLSNGPSFSPLVTKGLHDLLSFSLLDASPDKQVLKTFACGQGLKTYVSLATQYDDLDPELWGSIAFAAPRYSRLPLFLEGTLDYIHACPKALDLDESRIGPFMDALINNLAGPAHVLRLLSLKLLFELTTPVLEHDQSPISLAIEIEDSALSLQTARFLSMQMRKLAILFPQITSNKWLARLIPNFCFGLFSKKLSQLWDDSAEVLKSICDHGAGENIVTELAIQWLQESEAVLADNLETDESDIVPQTSSQFECHNVFRFEAILTSLLQRSKNAETILTQLFEKDHALCKMLPTSPRSHALRVLNAAPQVAEKRSRQIVPLLLQWTTYDEDSRSLAIASKSPASAVPDKTSPWAFKDRIALLRLFGKFNNPKVLYRSLEVQEALLGLLSNGDLELQKSALKALFTWKSPHVVPYQENLLNVLDESRLRHELTVFVHVGTEDSVIDKRHMEKLLPLLLRLLYGRMVSKAAHNGQGGQGGRRKAILRVLSQLPEQDFAIFIKICFSSLGELRLVHNDEIDLRIFEEELMSPRRQSGLLKMIETMFDTLQSHMLKYAASSMDVVVYCLVRACRFLKRDVKDDEVDSDKLEYSSHSALLRGIRQLGIRCLDLIFSVSSDIDWTCHVPTIFDEVINPRLDNFAIETAQGISGLLRLFHTWASSSTSIPFFARYNKDLLPKIVDCLQVESTRDEVKIFVMDQILLPIIEHCAGQKELDGVDKSKIAPKTIQAQVLSPCVDYILSHLCRLLEKHPSHPVMISGVGAVSCLAPFVESLKEVASLIKIITYLLRQPPDRVSPKIKAGLLRILQQFLPLYFPQEDSVLINDAFQAVVSLFDYFNDDENRQILSTVLGSFAGSDPELVEVAALCCDLNAMLAQRLDGVDYERRLSAFHKINEELWSILNVKQWQPLVYNMLYYMKDADELAIRSSASFGLRRFLERSSMNRTSDSAGFDNFTVKTVLPALQNGIRHKAEIVRSEFVSALGHLVKLNPTMPEVGDMHILLVGGDDEASFFSNILHIQQHRRLRSLRRLSSEVAQGKLQASNISSIFMPLVEQFIFNKVEDDNAHNLTAEAVNTVGTLAAWLEWKQFRAVFRRYRGYVQSKPELERNVIRLLGKMADALSTAIKAISPDKPLDVAVTGHGEPVPHLRSRLTATLPSSAKLSTELITQFLPFLTGFVHHKDESQVSSRLPVAVTTIKLLKLLPEDEVALRLSPVILDVCTILRSRAQESRDVARKTLADIALLLGPSYFGYILKELRSALSRGYQLHVLSFTVHSILVATTDHFKHGDLDHCLVDLVAVVLDDTFGATGQEKDAEGYISKMKEVKTRKSYDSMELLAKTASIQYLAHLIRPLQTLLREKLTAELVRKIDEMLRRIGIGLLRNPGAESRDMLVFCYEVIKETYQDPDASVVKPSVSAQSARYLVELNKRRGERQGAVSSFVYKLSRFALDVLRSILNKFQSLLTPTNLTGFLPIIGDALVNAHDEVKISAIRLLSSVVKLPLPEIDKNSNIYLTEAVKIVKEATNTNSEAVQASLKLIASILRERKSTTLRDGHLAYLLKRLSADIDEPDCQGVTFNFIKAVMERKFLVPEMYELIENIASMMITNQTRNSRDLARGTYIYFLIEYPQARGRWAKQLGFLVKNLDYQYREGRQSVMEAVHMLLAKTGGELAQEIIGTFFLPLVMVMANDEAEDCREMAGALLGELFSRADREQIQIILKSLLSWLDQVENMQLVSTGLQAVRIFYEADRPESEKEGRYLIELLPRLMNLILADRESEQWQVLYFSLQIFMRLCKKSPSIALSEDYGALWSIVRQSLAYPHLWIKTCAANLIGIRLADLAKSSASSGYGSVPLVGQYGLRLGEEAMLQLAGASLRCLQVPGVSEDLAMQSVRNIIFLCRCFAENGLGFTETADDEIGDQGLSNSGSDVEEEGGLTIDSPSRGSTPAIRFVFKHISNILRRETLTTKSDALIPKTASISLLAAMCRHLEAPHITPSLPILLLPLQHLTDPSIPPPHSSDVTFQDRFKTLVANGQEVLELLQSKLGTTTYVSQMAQAQEDIRKRREGRRIKRRIEAVADPEKSGREKKKRNERKHVKRKERGLEYRGQRRGW
ncbi:hypothetical protein V8E54_013778 [Elaphomyces granulatus]